MFEFISFSPRKLKINKRALLSVLEFHNEKEKLLVEYIIKEAIKENSKIYFLKGFKNLKGYIGVVALSASSIIIDKKIFPAISLDLLFVTNSYRKVRLKELNNKKVSEILLDFCVERSKELKDYIGIRYICLYPYNNEPKLTEFYIKYGFFKLKSNFMLLKI